MSTNRIFQSLLFIFIVFFYMVSFVTYIDIQKGQREGILKEFKCNNGMEQLKKIEKQLSGKENHKEKGVGKNYKCKEGRGKEPQGLMSNSRNGGFALTVLIVYLQFLSSLMVRIMQVCSSCICYSCNVHLRFGSVQHAQSFFFPLTMEVGKVHL